MVMLGVLCGSTNLLLRESLEAAITLRMPHQAAQNLHMFAAGWNYTQESPHREDFVKRL
jgi:Pyruvate/2-oxoacid:ferredoxin oxidoreductase gamma subunit